MPAERAGYTVTMFLIDISPSMGKMRQVQVLGSTPGEVEIVEMTNLEWATQFVMLKIQEMIYHNRKTDLCGVMLFGSEGTDNVVYDENGGYEHVTDHISIGKPNAGTLAKLQALEPSTIHGDPVDALIVAIETQDRFLEKKKTWTRKIVLLTDGENPIELEDWDATTKKMNALEISLSVIGVDFDDEELPFHEEDKSHIKRTNEEFYHNFVNRLDRGIVGNCEFALREINRPDVKETRSQMQGTILRLGDVDVRPEEAAEILCKVSKATAVQRPKSWKRFARREKSTREEESAIDVDEEKAVFAQLRMRTEYYIDRDPASTEDGESAGEGIDDEKEDKHHERVEKEQLVRGFKYGSSYAPCLDGQFPKLVTRKGVDICGFFKSKNFRREHAMSEVTYLWADPQQPLQQAALSALVQAMYEKGCMAIAKWVTKDGSDPKMGVLHPVMFEKVDCLMFVRMPFAEDVRNFAFPSLENLVSKKGEPITRHPYLPTEEQLEAMKRFVDAMDLMDAGEKDEEGNRMPWFDTRLSYNPAIHRAKQAQFHAAVVTDLSTYPLPPPHPELTKYFEPPKKALKRARDAVEECKDLFRVKEVPKKVARTRKDGHVRARDEDDDTILLDKMAKQPKSVAQPGSATQQSQSQTPHPQVKEMDESETEDEEEPLLDRKTPRSGALPTPTQEDVEELDRGQAPGRIIGSTYPLEDFRSNIVRGDVVTKAVEDLAAVIKEVVLRPFAARRTEEMIQCMQELRQVALEEDEIDAWNVFLRDLRESCLSDQLGNTGFWTRVKDEGRELSLISEPEAGKLGGRSDVSELEAAKFIRQ